MLQFKRLVSGGIITNYYCSSKCKHCVYGSSQYWPRDYMSAETAAEIFSLLVKSGCDTVHIGGGEPLLNPDKLFPILEAARESGINIEYIETNASWHKDGKKTEELLRKLKAQGVHTLLISIDPFHNEYIPFNKTKGLIEACKKAGMGVFPWLMEFWGDLDTMDDTQTHSLEEYTKVFGEDYKWQLIQRYQLNLRGRALQSFKEYLKTYYTEEILHNSGPCRELSGVYHFHIDLYGNFVPQSCAGLSMHYQDVLTGARPEKYPLLHALYSIGIKGLYDLAVKKYGFKEKESYKGKCDLCYDIRRYLVMDLKLDLPDLQPSRHYVLM